MSASSPICIDGDSPLSSFDTSSDVNAVSNPIAPNDQPRKLRIYDKRVPLKRKVFVSLPRLSSERKLLYKPINKSSLSNETRVDEVIGEYRQENTLYYFARYDGGIARKVRVLKHTRLPGINCYLTSTLLRHSLVIMAN
jgi:hypothetical protein